MIWSLLFSLNLFLTYFQCVMFIYYFTLLRYHYNAFNVVDEHGVLWDSRMVEVFSWNVFLSLK